MTDLDRAAPDGAGAAAAAARAGGAVLSGLIGLVSRLRPARKPLHPYGVQLPGTLTREGCRQHWDVPWLDGRGTGDVITRLSRGVGLPPSLPDILGLAIRVSDGDKLIDLLFSTTGSGRLSRFLLVPRRAAEGSYGTLMPYRTPAGPVMLGARLHKRQPPADVTTAGATVLLFAARPRGPWHRFGRIELAARGQDADDPPMSFDPVRNPPPDLPPYPWTRRLRERAYATARRRRGERLR